VADRLREEFRRRAEEALAGHPDLRHEWTPDMSGVRFPRVDDFGFDVEVSVGDQEPSGRRHPTRCLTLARTFRH